MTPMQQLTQHLGDVHRLLQEGDVQRAAGVIALALQACANSRAAVPDLESVPQAIALQQQCAALAQTVVEGLVKTAKASGTHDRAIRAYSDAGQG